MTRHQLDEAESGAGLLAAIIVLTAVLLAAAAGLMIDGSRVLTVRRHATTIAFETARAGAQALAPDSARTATPTLDPAAADSAAREAFTRLATDTPTRLVTVTVNITDVTVTVTEPVHPVFGLLGPSTVTVTGHARIIGT